MPQWGDIPACGRQAGQTLEHSSTFNALAFCCRAKRFLMKELVEAVRSGSRWFFGEKGGVI